MKKFLNKLEKILIIFIFIVTFTETVVYYQEVFNSIWLLLLEAIINGIRVFGFNSTIALKDVSDLLQSNISLGIQVLNYSYALSVLIGPLLLAVNVYKFVNYALNNRIRNILPSKKKRVVIVGYNHNVLNLVKEITASKKRAVVLYNGELSEREKSALSYSGAVVCVYEFLEYSKKKERDKQLNYIKPGLVSDIILFEQNQIDNVHNYNFFIKCLEEENSCGFSKSVRIDCNYESPDIERLIWECYSKSKAIDSHTLNTFSVSLLRTQAVLKVHKIYENVLNSQVEKMDCIHILIVGFGQMGRCFLKRAINQAVVDFNTKIIVDIIDACEKETDWYFKEECREYYDLETRSLNIGPDIVDGELIINCHTADIRDSHFDDLLKSMANSNPVTYVAICLNETDLNISCMMDVQQILTQNQDLVPNIVVRMDSINIANEINELYENAYIMPSDMDSVTMQSIHNEDLEIIKQSIHRYDDVSQKAKYVSPYQIESRDYRMFHYDVKCRIVELFKKEEWNLAFHYLCTEIYMKKDQDTFAVLTMENPSLWKMAAIEHRRWSYYSILCGWSYAMEKNDALKQTNYICPLNKLLKDKSLRDSVYYEFKDWRVALMERRK